MFMLAVCALPVSALAVDTAPSVTLTASGGTGTDGNFYPGDTVTITVSIETKENAGLYGFEITLPSGDITVAWDAAFAADHGEGEASGTKIVWTYGDIDGETEETGAAISGAVLTLTYKLPSAYEFGDSTTLEQTFAIDFTAAGLPIVQDGEYTRETAYDLDASVTLTVEKRAYVLGDLNDDTKINMKDLFLMRQHLASMEVVFVTEAADLNKDTKINMKDLFLMRQYLAGVIDSFD